MKNHKKITKAVISVAGLGTRFLPATKNQPKEMLPVIDKPIIHYLVEEAVASGIEDIILVTRAGSHIMEDYFDNRPDLEYNLEKAGKLKILEVVENIPLMANFVYVRQKKNLPYGNGSPLLVAQKLIDDDESFVYMFGDDMTISHEERPVTKQIMDAYQESGADVIMGVQEIPEHEAYLYGTIKYQNTEKGYLEVERVVEKPKQGEVPSNMAVFGRYVFNSKVFAIAQKTEAGKDSELWMTDILNNMLAQQIKIVAQPINGEWLTTGDPLRFLKTTLKFAMEREDLKQPILDFIKNELN